MIASLTSLPAGERMQEQIARADEPRSPRVFNWRLRGTCEAEDEEIKVRDNQEAKWQRELKSVGATEY